MDKKTLKIAIFALAFLLVGPFYATPLVSQAENLLQYQKYDEAITVLRSALLQEPENEQIYLYLANTYEKLKRYDEAIQILQQGLPKSKLYKDRFYLSLGNCLYAQGKDLLAAEMYTAAMGQNLSLPEPYLNRAQTGVRLKKYPEAITDYRKYLDINPTTPKKPEILKLIGYLEAQIAADAAAKAQQDAAAAAAEAERQRLLKEILDSLDNANTDTTTFGAGTEDIVTDNPDIEIEM